MGAATLGGGPKLEQIALGLLAATCHPVTLFWSAVTVKIWGSSIS
ncbi:hypothetical protein [Dyella sp. 333MFSha]|nr:hypothetical protein [Dyella sp. 333MFSha]